MEVQLAEGGPCRRTLTIKISPEHVREHLDQAYRNASHKVKLKGFRAGKVPRQVLEKKFGEAIRAEAKESLINRSLEEALRQEQLSVVGRPKFDGIDDTPLEDDQTIEFRVEFDIRPQFELGEVKGIEVEAESTEVTDEDVESALGQLADQKKTLDTIAEPIAEGDFIKADLTFSNDAGETVLTREGVQLNTNIPVAGTDPEEFSRQLLEKEKGQSVDIELKFPPNFDVEELRGSKGTVTVAIHEVLRVQPAPIDDELAKGFDMESLDRLREHLRERIAEEKERGETSRREETILEVIANDHPFDLPESLVADQTEHQLESFRERLRRNKTPDAEIDRQIEEVRGQAEQEATRRVRMYFVLDAIAKKEGISVSETDIDVELRALAAHHGVSPGEVRENYEKNNLLADLRLGILERKVREFLREHAQITDNTHTND
jgi:trigger factor